ncbi:AAA family ATPase [Desulfovibrio intestinalis]|uniref:Cobyrinic acid a,c-diamide synthase n=1 Tax=Desulfovibrio intestinalis TaxID=58621 RepID=A0A7W8C1S2_9BACT|nr:AAA family ATPase [Desulfovibrio intestinalis]MBB5144040.1 cobyrinic acid a,c-diamide synthase [Desulfovibrio intestinalis]
MHTEQPRIPGIVIGGTGSNTGKTTVTLALLCALASRGLAVRAAKTGPDYIDAAFHAAITGQPAANLDTWMCRQLPANPQEKPSTDDNRLPQGLQTVFNRMSASSVSGGAPHMLLVEGAMGLYDGGHRGAGSTAQLAALLDLPILLVCSAAGLGQSVAALVEGYLRHKPQWLNARSTPPRFLGIVCTHIGSQRHAEIISDALKPLEKSDNIPLMALLPRAGAPELQSRHLGLVEAREALPALDRAALAQWLENNCRLDDLLKQAGVAAPKAKAASAKGTNEVGKEAEERRDIRGSKDKNICSVTVSPRAAHQTNCDAPAPSRLTAVKSAAPVPQHTDSARLNPEPENVAAQDAMWCDALAARFFPPRQPGAKAIRKTATQSASLGVREILADSSALPLQPTLPAQMKQTRGKSCPVVGMAWDAAFSFCYADLPALLTELGADVVPFSPLRDAAPPSGCTALYFPGGYPELHAEELAGNTLMLQALRELAHNNMPIYGECGGYIYLMQSLRLEGASETRKYDMAGLLPSSCTIGRSRTALGYRAALALPGWPAHDARPAPSMTPYALPDEVQAGVIQPNHMLAGHSHANEGQPNDIRADLKNDLLPSDTLSGCMLTDGMLTGDMLAGGVQQNSLQSDEFTGANDKKAPLATDSHLIQKISASESHSAKSLWVRGHEFHYAREDDGPLPPHCTRLWQLHDSKGAFLRQEGCRCGSVAGTWLHCYPEGSRTFWRAWLKMATPLP